MKKETTKLSLKVTKDTLSRAEMKAIMAGTGTWCLGQGEQCYFNSQCCDGYCVWYNGNQVCLHP